MTHAEGFRGFQPKSFCLAGLEGLFYVKHANETQLSTVPDDFIFLVESIRKLVNAYFLQYFVLLYYDAVYSCIPFISYYKQIIS